MIVGAIAFLVSAGLIRALQAVVTGYGNPTVIAMTVGLVLTGLMLWNMWRQPTAEAFGATNADKEMLEGYLFLIPKPDRLSRLFRRTLASFIVREFH